MTDQAVDTAVTLTPITVGGVRWVILPIAMLTT